MFYTGVDIEEMRAGPGNYMPQLQNSAIGHPRRPHEESRVGNSGDVNQISSDKNNAGEQKNKSKKHEKFSGPDSHSSTRVTSVGACDIENGRDGSITTGASGKDDAATDTFAHGKSKNEEVMEDKRKAKGKGTGKGKDKADRRLGEAEYVHTGTEEETPALIQGGNSSEVIKSPITPEQEHMGNDLTGAKTMQGKEVGKSQDKPGKSETKTGKSQEKATRTQEETAKIQEEVPRIQEEPAKTVEASTEDGTDEFTFRPLPYDSFSFEPEDLVVPRFQTPELPPSPKVTAGDSVPASATGASASVPMVAKPQGEALTEQGIIWDNPELEAFLNGMT